MQWASPLLSIAPEQLVGNLVHSSILGCSGLCKHLKNGVAAAQRNRDSGAAGAMTLVVASGDRISESCKISFLAGILAEFAVLI